MRKLITLIILITFSWTSLGFPQTLPSSSEFISLSPENFNLPFLRGIKFYPDNPLKFDFIIEKGYQPSAES